MGVLNKRYEYFKNGGVSCDSVIAADAGRDIMSMGGSGVDTAIATLLVNGMSNAHSMGLGGGFFMIYYNAHTRISYSVDSRECAITDEYSTPGCSAIALPSELEGYRTVHAKWGVLPWRYLFRPAIKYALSGFPVSPALSRAIESWYPYLKENKMDTLLLQLTNPQSNLAYKTGEIMKWPALARTFQLLADGDFDTYYSEMINDLNDNNCDIGMDDFKNYNVRIAKPLVFNIPNNGSTISVLSHPPPSGGCIVSLILNLLCGVQRNDIGKRQRGSLRKRNAQFVHRYIESAKLAYPAFEFVGDADFHGDVTEITKNMLDVKTGQGCAGVIKDCVSKSDRYKYLRKLIEPSPLNSSSIHRSKLGLNEDLGGTAHTCIVAPNGDAVSITSSINHYFGSRVMGHRTGVIFNNTMEDFEYVNRTRSRLAVPQRQRHLVIRKARPPSAMSPIIVMMSPDQPDCDSLEDGIKFCHESGVYMLCGGAGGSRIVGAVSYILAQSLLAPQPLLISSAIAIPRIRHLIYNSISNHIILENGFSNKFKRRLESFGHKIESESSRYTTVISGIQFVAHSDYPWLVCCDYRKDGWPSGL